MVPAGASRDNTCVTNKASTVQAIKLISGCTCTQHRSHVNCVCIHVLVFVHCMCIQIQ